MDIESILEDFFNNFKKVEVLNKEKNNELSKVDIELSEFYHELEGVHLSHNTQAHVYMTKLKDILSRRRQLKKETILIRSFVDTIKQSIDISKQRHNNAISTHNKVMNEIKNKHKVKTV